MVSKTIWRLPEVISHTGLTRSTIYVKMNLDEFPQSIKLGARSIGWVADEIEQWILDRIEASRTDDQAA